MKWIVGIIVAVSLGFNVYFISSWYESHQFAEAFNANANGKYDNLKDGTAYLRSRLSREQPHLLEKRYLYISIWNMACGPCIREMPLLDSLAGHVERKDIGYIYLTENSDALIQAFLKRRNLSCRNFVYLNDGNDYIMALIKSQGLKSKGYPIQVIVDSQGAIRHFGGEYIQSSRDSAMIALIQGLPR